MTKKHITAPLSYDPGKGRPKEYLAYLNWQEMQALQRLNGGNMERGPRGLPSFPPADAIGSNQTPGTGNWTGAPGSGTTSTGAGSSTGGGSDSGNVSGGMTSATSAASTSATNTAESSDTDAQQAAAVNNAISAANNQALNQDASRGGISSIPVGPQQTPVKIGSGPISQAVNSAAQQSYVSSPVTQSSIASTGYYHSFADTLPATQSIGKFSTRISPSNLVNEYGNPMESWSNGYDPNKLTEGAKKIHQAIADQSLRMGVPVDYFSGRRAYNPATRTQQHSLGQAIDIRINDPVTGKPVGYDEIGGLAYNPIGNVARGRNGSYIRNPEQASRIQSALAGPYREFATGVLGSFYSNPDVYGGFDNQRWGGSFEGGRYAKDYMHFDEGRAAAGVSGDQARLRREAIALANSMSSNPSAYASYAPLKDRAALYSDGSASTTTDQTQAAANLADTENSYNPGVIGDPMASLGIAGLTRLPSVLSSFSLPSIPEGSTAQKAALGLAKTFKSEADYQKLVNDEIAKAINRSGFSLADSFASGIGALNAAMSTPTQVAGKLYQDRLVDLGGVTKEVPAESFERMSPEDQARINEYQQAQRYDPNFSGPYGAVPNGNVADSGAPATVNPDDFVGPTYVTTDIQKIMEDQERKNRRGTQVIKRGAPFVGTGLSIAEGIQKLFTGKDIADYGTDLKNRYMQEGPEGRAALRAKYPDMRRFAVSIGDIPPNTGTQFASSGDLSRELGGKDNRQNYYMDQVAYSPPVISDPEKGTAMNTGRPYKHYLWDLGVDVPSPGDPDYNDYVKYLKKRDNSSDV